MDSYIKIKENMLLKGNYFLGTKRERVLRWASAQYNEQISPRYGWVSNKIRYPNRDEIVLGFEEERRIAHLLRHKVEGIYDILGENDAWFDDPTERSLNIID